MTVINQVGNALTGSTGTGAFVGATSPTIATPVITDGTYNVLQFLANGTVANNWQMYGGTAGNAPIIRSIGSDSNINAYLASKGTGAVYLYTANLTTPLVLISGTSNQHTASFVFTNAATSPNYTFPDSTMTIAGQALALGGTNANLTASNGGIVYSTASAMAILAGTATAGQLLTSGASTTPAWTTSTYPATNAVNTLLYASSANVMAALATANSSVLVTSAGGVPSLSTTLPSGIAATNMSLTTPTLGVATATSVVVTKVNGTEAANAVTASGNAGVITTSSLSTAGAGNYAITWTNTKMTATSGVSLCIVGGTNTVQNITFKCAPGSGTATLTIYNNTVATALNGTILISYQVF
jgi:hypothetical protein